MKRIRGTYIILAALVLCNVLFVRLSASAATRTWTGAGVTGNWSLTNNWTSNIRPTNSDDISFPASGVLRGTVNDLLGTVHSLTFGDDGYSIQGNGLTLTNGISCTNTNGSSTLANGAVTLGADQSFTNLNPGTELTVLTLNLNGHDLTLRGAGTNHIGNLIQDTAGGGSLTNLGTGIFLVSASNSSFTGSTTLSSGTNIFNGFFRRSPIIWTGGTLGGTGHLGQVTASGVAAKQLAPGYGGTGILETSNVVLNSSVTVAIQINGVGPGTNHDQLVVTNGNLAIGSATLSLSFLSSLTNSFGDTFTLINLPNAAS